jgi:GTP-binding protein HflX
MRTLVLHPARPGSTKRDPQDALSEAVNLAAALDLDVVDAIAVPLPKARAGTLFGTGKVAELRQIVADREVGLVIVDGRLSPIQQRNLERDWKCKILDRTGLILEIFGERARTREGVLQVELAHLDYQKSRLVRSWTHLERQRGGFGFLGGPGETQIEADRRAINERITRIRQSLEKAVRTRGQHRAARKRTSSPVVALVGYTNAGKSTLFNRLTGADVMAEDMLFATLDPTMRAVELPGGREIILSDTVGFISDLPTQLVAAFRATLEEVLEADLILHVRDIVHSETDLQAANVSSILGQLGLGEDRRDRMIEVWNKIDLLAPDEACAMIVGAERRDRVVPISAVTGQGIDILLARVETVLEDETRDETVIIDFSDGRRRAWLFDGNFVLDEKATEKGLEILVRWSVRDRARFADL